MIARCTRWCAVLAASAVGVPAVAQIQFGEPWFAQCTPLHYPTRARLFDMDGDGRPDIVLPGRDRDGLLDWVPILEDGSLGTVRSMRVEGQTDDAVAADIDGDGEKELLLAIRAYSGKLQVLRRAADGSMQAEAALTLDREPRSMAAGDFDGDGDVDVAMSFYGSEHVAVLANDGKGRFAVRQRVRVDPWAGGIPGPQDIAAGDLDRDGRTDLVVGCTGTRRFDILFGRADGTFRGPVSWVAPDFPGVTRPAVTSFDLGDVDSDGDLDIAAPLLNGSGGQPLVIFRNDGSGGFAAATMVGQVTPGLHWSALLADLDGDGDLDAVTGTALPGGIHVWRNVSASGSIAFAAPGFLDYSAYPRHFLATNLDGDCDLDLVAADIAGHYVLAYPNLRACAALVPGGAAVPVPPLKPLGVSFGPSPSVELALRLAGTGADLRAGDAAAGFGAPGACGPAGPGGRCDEAHATPGCFTTPCCEAVCALLPECCSVAWEQACVDLADTECDGMVCPSYGGCTVVHAEPGCEDPACCDRITPLDGYCAGATWDWVCAERARQLCGHGPCEIEFPPGARPDDEPCYRRSNDGPSRDGATSALACGEAASGSCTTGSPRDVDWYSLAGSGQRRVRITVLAEFPVEMHLMRGPLAGPLEVRGSSFGGRCEPVVAEACIDGSQPWHAAVSLGMDVAPIRGGQPCTVPDPDHPPPPGDPPVQPGFDGTDYWIRLECLSCPPFGDLDGNGRVDGADLVLLLGSWGAPPPAAGDLNADGRIDGADIALLLGAWTPAP